MAHYHEERNHQGLENRLIRPQHTHAANAALVQRRPRLGGILNYYYRANAASARRARHEIEHFGDRVRLLRVVPIVEALQQAFPPIARHPRRNARGRSLVYALQCVTRE
jgi:hypothetical protein